MGCINGKSVFTGIHVNAGEIPGSGLPNNTPICRNNDDAGYMVAPDKPIVTRPPLNPLDAASLLAKLMHADVLAASVAIKTDILGAYDTMYKKDFGVAYNAAMNTALEYSNIATEYVELWHGYYASGYDVAAPEFNQWYGRHTNLMDKSMRVRDAARVMIARQA